MDITALFSAMPGAIAQGLIWGIMAIGVYITYRVLNMADLTVDGTMCTGGAVMVVLMTNFNMNIWVALLIATLVGMLVGLMTGVFHVGFGIPDILAGILSQIALYAINLKIMGKSNVPINVDNFGLLVSLRYVKVPFVHTLASGAHVLNSIAVIVIFVIVIIAVLYWFFGTEIGSAMRATGCNPNMARAQGINTNVSKILGLVISNGIVALSSALLAQYQGFADVNMGRGAIVIGLAAVIIGEALFSKIFKNFALSLLAVAIGGIIYYVVIQIILWCGFDPNLLKLFQAIVVAIFLGFPYWKRTFFNKSKVVRKEAK